MHFRAEPSHIAERILAEGQQSSAAERGPWVSLCGILLDHHEVDRLFPMARYQQDRLSMVLDVLLEIEALVERARYEASLAAEADSSKVSADLTK
jgi:hypothetical protein